MSEKMEQGETYEEVTTDESAETPAKTGHMDKVKIIALALVAVFVIGALFIFVLGKKNGASTNDSGDDYSYDDSGDSYSDEFWEEDTQSAQEIYTGNFTDKEIESLRKWGYTGDEIEYYMNSGLDYDTLVSSAKELQSDAQKEVIDELNDTASGAYKKLLNMTWLGGKDFKVKKINPDTDENGISYEDIIENVDYVKCGAKGKQLFIRCTLDDGTNIFMMVPPERWVTMRKKGNIVIQYTLESYGKTKVITAVAEVEQSSMYDSSDDGSYDY